MRVLHDHEVLAVRVTDERLAHILEHPEMAGMEEAIEATLRVGDRYLCVVVKVAGDDAFVLTAYLTDRIKKGVALWPRES